MTEEEIRTVCEQHSTGRRTYKWGVGSDAVVGPALSRSSHAAESLEAARTFQRALFDSGLANPEGPPEMGGSNMSREDAAAVRSVIAEYTLPDRTCFMIGQEIVAPAIAAFGRPEQKARWLASLWRGDAIGCQLFSEPGAGSDLASLRTSAIPDGDGWRIRGQKLWSSGAHLSDVGELLVRTGGEGGRSHSQLSMFLVDMSDPAITTVPIRQINGNTHFNEVFIDDLYVPGDALLGQVGQGWAVANASLSSERDLSVIDAGIFVRPIERIVELVKVSGLSTDPLVRQRLVDVLGRVRLAEITARRLSAGDGPITRGVPSILKLEMARNLTAVAELAATVAGPALVADTGDWGLYCWSDFLLGTITQHIAGGTDEIQRNILAERVLGLPKEPRPQS